MDLKERLSKLYLNETGADVHFLVDGVSFLLIVEGFPYAL